MQTATVNGMALRALREKRRLTLAELADAAGIHEASLSNIERGERQPSAKTWGRICDALGLDDAAAAALLVEAQAA